MEITKMKSEIDTFLKSINYSLYNLEIVKENKDKILRIYIDKPEGVSIDDIVKVTKLINPFIDELDPLQGSYLLEVSSPGAERELRSEAAIKHAINRLVHVDTFNQSLEGDLINFDGDSLTVLVNNKKIKLNYLDVNSIKLAIDFRRKK